MENLSFSYLFSVFRRRIDEGKWKIDDEEKKKERGTGDRGDTKATDKVSIGL